MNLAQPVRRGSVLAMATLAIAVALFFPPKTRGAFPVTARCSVPSPQEDCGWPYFNTLYAVNTLCCPNGTCAEFLCQNVFCRTIFIGSYRCWQDLALCGVLYCPSQTIQLWREADRAIHCQVGPILTRRPAPRGFSQWEGDMKKQAIWTCLAMYLLGCFGFGGEIVLAQDQIVVLERKILDENFRLHSLEVDRTGAFYFRSFEEIVKLQPDGRRVFRIGAQDYGLKGFADFRVAPGEELVVAGVTVVPQSPVMKTRVFMLSSEGKLLRSLNVSGGGGKSRTRRERREFTARPQPK